MVDKDARAKESSAIFDMFPVHATSLMFISAHSISRALALNGVKKMSYIRLIVHGAEHEH